MARKHKVALLLPGPYGGDSAVTKDVDHARYPRFLPGLRAAQKGAAPYPRLGADKQGPEAGRYADRGCVQPALYGEALAGLISGKCPALQANRQNARLARVDGSCHALGIEACADMTALEL